MPGQNSIPVPRLDPLTSRLLSTLVARDQYLFTSREARRIVRRNASAANKLLHTLVRQGHIQRLEKGKFLLRYPHTNEESVGEHEFLVAMQLVQPSYIGYGTALHYHGLTEQLATSSLWRRQNRKGRCGFTASRISVCIRFFREKLNSTRSGKNNRCLRSALAWGC